VQSFFYLALVESRIRDCHPGADVISFGYFFPGTAGHGERIEWCREELVEGMQVLASLCEMLSLGSFPFTDNDRDVKYSDYRAAFGDIERTLRQTKLKLANAQNGALSPFRELRGMKKGEG
jgi:hypothetical protein